VTDLPKLAPGLNIDAGVGVALPFLRGVGNPSNVLGNESSVAFYVDGVYVSRLQPSFLDFLDVERIEVRNGPQGTLFGRNASALCRAEHYKSLMAQGGSGHRSGAIS
jgi:iron complex outermembrane recepter protein